MSELLPREIVAELDRHIVGQEGAKRAVAIALRNRWRRQHVDSALRGEIIPNNIIMIGPTGVGKTEIARRLAAVAHAPFAKVEASKFTEVGYVGRDVEAIIRDLVDLGISMVRKEHDEAMRERAESLAQERLCVLLRDHPEDAVRGGLLDGELVEVETRAERLPVVEIIAPTVGMEGASLNIQEIVSGMLGAHPQMRRVTVAEARRLFVQEELHKLVDSDLVVREGLERVQQSGIVFLDELDKIVGDGAKAGPDVSREGVQRDLLPIIEGCTVNTKHGPVRTDHILFIAAGAFHGARPSDLIPELQGRFPIRVELDSLEEDDLMRILTQPEGALVKQYTALLAADGVTLSFTREAVRAVAAVACEVNERTENIGARRLHTIMSTLLEDALFDAPGKVRGELRLDRKTVLQRLHEILEDEDLSRYVL